LFCFIQTATAKKLPALDYGQMLAYLLERCVCRFCRSIRIFSFLK
jgi:hypothetical protein